MQKYKFSCGCSFDIIDDNKLIFSPKVSDINLLCDKTWKLISDGNTKGIFQLESRFGQTTAKKLKPENIQQLSALIAVLRPGSLEAIRDGKSITNHYIDRKNGQESIDYFHPILETVLQDTYGEMIYQEQAMEISRIIAGFNLQEADELRKSIGKKDTKLMAKTKTKFLQGCKNLNKVTIEEAEEIFGWIEKAQRYQFNLSHSVSYAMNAYLSAYTKAHFPQAFFCSYLRFAKDKVDPQQEIKELVSNANEMDILVCLPDIRLLNKLFTIHNTKIYFGLTDIKGIGLSVYDKILELNNTKNIEHLPYTQLLFEILHNINSTAAKALICCGALDYFKKNRTEILFEYELSINLTKKEKEYCQELIDINSNLSDIFTYLINHSKTNIKRKKIIRDLLAARINPPFSLLDKIDWLADNESSALGVAISCSKLDTYDIAMTNTNCKEFKNTTHIKNILIAGEIANINIVKTKTGQNPGQEMAFVSIEDQTGMLDSVIFFPNKYEEYKHHLFESNILIFSGNKAKAKDGLIVEKCFVPYS
jgi:DNA polymerase-3 subunit alpha